MTADIFWSSSAEFPIPQFYLALASLGQCFWDFVKEETIQ